MRGIFCARGTANLEEYKRVVKLRIGAQLFLAVIGIATIIVSICMSRTGASVIPEFAQGFFMGIGSGLTVAGVVFAIQLMRLLKNETKLKEKRIEENDERLIAINHSAIRLAAMVLIFAMYVVMLVGVFFSKELVMCLAGLITLFIVVYKMADVVFSKRM